jgi:geranylgeranyl reductase family protein
MTRQCDVAVVGGGPAGSSCALALRRAGADVVVVDGARFPRQKVCAGWITPRLFDLISLDPAEYRAAGLVLQDVRAFRTGVIGEPRAITTRYEGVVSHVIRRIEFDDYLLRRSGAEVLDHTRVTGLRRVEDGWLIDDRVCARTLVGAGGHFCPVARLLNPPGDSATTVIGRELEVRVAGSDSLVDGISPELYFCRDLDGYGWCVRKGDYVNVGFGRRTARDFNEHTAAFAAWLRGLRRLPEGLLDWTTWKGHAYRIRQGRRRVAGAGVLLAGDAAAMAWPESGEGIVPAVESGLAAARAIVDAGASLATASFAEYAALVAPATSGRGSISLPPSIGRRLLRVPLVARLAIDRWFLRIGDAPLSVDAAA